MKKLILLISLVIVSCSQGVTVDDGDWSGTINANSEESKIVEKLAAAYVNGNFEIAMDHLAEGAVHEVNGVEFTNEEWVAGYKQDQEVFDNIKHNDANITTMYYNNGRVFTNHWLTWTGNSRLTGEENTIHYYGFWEWKDGKIIATGAYMDTQWYFAEIGRYLDSK